MDGMTGKSGDRGTSDPKDGTAVSAVRDGRAGIAAAALGMEVYGYDPFISVKAAWMLSRDVKHITSVDTIYQECDYITVHVPLLDSTRQMINKDSLGQMKDGVVILNFARDFTWIRSIFFPTFLSKECAKAHSRTERGRLRHISASRKCASSRSVFCFI